MGRLTNNLKLKSFFKQLAFVLILFSFLIMVLNTPVSAENEDLLSSCFVNQSKGWACGRWGKVITTDDGGMNWLKQSTPIDYTLSSIDFVTDQIGIAVGDEGIIIRTEDGGKNWTVQTSPVKLFLMDVTFTSPTTGFIVTERTTILKTSDGGKSWKVVFQDEDFILKSISFADYFNGWAVGEYGYIYKTSDGGNSWKHQAGYYDISDQTGDIEGEAFLFDVHAVDPLIVWAVGIDGIIIQTTDGGSSWRVIQVKTPKVPFFSITSNNRDKICVVGDGIVFQSNNNGNSWSKVNLEPAFPYGWLYHVTAKPYSDSSTNKKSSGKQIFSDEFIACGQGGTIYSGTPKLWNRIHPDIKPNPLTAKK